MKIHPFVISLAFVFLMTGCSPKDPNNPAFVVAKVNGTKIYRRDLDEERNFQLRGNSFSGNLADVQKAQIDHRILDQMIKIQAFKDAAGSTSTEIAAQAKQEFEKMKSDPNFIKSIQTTGISPAKMEQRIRDDLTIKAFFEKELEKNSKSIQATEADAKIYYDANPLNFQVPEQSQAKYIMVKIEADTDAKTAAAKRKRIEDARSRIVSKKETFEDVTKKLVAEDVNSASGGLTPKMAHFQGQTDTPFVKALFAQPINEVGPIFTIQIPASSFQKASTQLEFLQVVEKTPARKITFEEVRDKILQHLNQFNKNNFAMKDMAAIRAKADVQIFLPSLPTPQSPAPSIPSPFSGTNHISPPPILPQALSGNH